MEKEKKFSSSSNKNLPQNDLFWASIGHLGGT